jgi:triosephosphate isomerase
MRRRIIAGNWKMYKTARETAEFFERFRALLPKTVRCDVVVFPAAITIPAAVAASAGSHPPIGIGGQNLYWGKEGAFTGEISGEMLRTSGAAWVLAGHSERRHTVAHETDAQVLKKAQAGLAAGLTPVICIGEKLEEHKAGKTEEQFAQIVVAYEPVWAIGTGLTATPEIAASAHRAIRSEAEKRFGAEAAQQMRILYGGSVKPDNIEGLLREEEIDGALVGGASLDPESFYSIVRAA